MTPMEEGDMELIDFGQPNTNNEQLNTVMTRPTYRIIQACITVVDDDGKTRVLSGEILHTEDGLILLGSKDFQFDRRDGWHISPRMQRAA